MFVPDTRRHARRSGRDGARVNAIAFRIRLRLRRDWRSVLACSIAVAVVGTALLAFAAGAARTASTPARYVAAHASDADAVVWQEAGISRRDEIAALASVDSIASATFMMAGLVPSGSDAPADALVFAGSARAAGATLVAGRDPTTPHEFVATASFVEGSGSAIGDAFQLISLTQEQADRFGFDVDDPKGPSFEATLVGVVDGVQDGDPSRPVEPVAVFPTSVLDGVDIGVKSSVMTVSVGRGEDLATLRADLDTLGEAAQFRVEPIQLVSESVQASVRAQASGLWVMTAVSAVTSVAALGQLATRRARLADTDRLSLTSIGFTAREIVAESVATSSIPVLGGALAAVVGAAAVSGIFPTGFARAIEPHPGVQFDAPVVVLGAVGFALAIVLWTWCALVLGRARVPAPGLSPVVERLAVACPTSASATGLRFAYGSARLDSGFARASLWGVVLASAGVVGALTVGSSLDRLIDDPTRHGRSFDMVVGDAGQTVPSEDLRRALTSDPDVEGLTLMTSGQGRTGGTTLLLVGFERLRGKEVIRVLEGRLPSGPDEIALGRLAARDLGVDLGDELSLDGATSTRTFNVTGLVVMPSVGGNDGVGEDGLVTLTGLQRLDDAAVGVALGFKLRPNSPPDTLQRIASDFNLEAAGSTDIPEVVRNLDRIRAVPYLLVVLILALGVLTVAHAMFTSARHRRRDLAVLGALGADRSWLTRVVHWQATLFTLAPILIGAPVGFVVGRQVFRGLADGVGVANDASLPFLVVVSVELSLVVLANLAAAVPARQARKITLTHLVQSSR